MKTLYIILITAICINGYSQTARSAHNKNKRTRTSKNHTNRKAVYNQTHNNNTIAQPRQTVTEKYLKGPSGKNANADTSARRSAGNTNPFVGGIHAAPDAGEKFDTTNKNMNVNNVNTPNTMVTPVAAPNDTIFNANTITDNGTTTNSGAVDRSGQSQFGQTNWGNSRSTVGESQWTIPPPVTASFNKEFPAAARAVWSRNNTDTSIYSARYKSGDLWVTTNYSFAGKRLDMRTEVPLTLLPQPVSAYISKLPANLPVTTVSKWEVLGKADVYEIKTKTGKTMYVNNDGAEVNYSQQR